MGRVFIEPILNKTGSTRLSLVSQAAHIARANHISPVAALRLLEEKDIDMDKLQSDMIDSMRVNIPIEEEENESSEDDL